MKCVWYCKICKGKKRITEIAGSLEFGPLRVVGSVFVFGSLVTKSGNV